VGWEKRGFGERYEGGIGKAVVVIVVEVEGWCLRLDEAMEGGGEAVLECIGNGLKECL
jgi:hypothetical protein